MSRVRLKSYAKINLCLEILGRRDDGYHELSTVFQAVSLADYLTLEVRGRTIELEVPGGGAPAGPDNLCWRAVEAYRHLRGWPGGLRVELHKRVPSGAGLGGGSSNAAAVLRGLAAIDDRPPGRPELLALAAEIGSDVAFFVEGGTALGRGRGELLEALPALPDCRIVLAQPRLHVSTAEAYGMLEQRDFTDGARARAMVEALLAGSDLRTVAGHVFNGFTRALSARWPQLAELSRALVAAGAAAAAVSGSGSAVFGLFVEPEQARTAMKRLRADGLWTTVVEPARSGCEIIHR